MHPVIKILLTLALAAAGGAAFTAVGFPAGWLAGAMIVVAAAALGGVKVGLPEVLRDVAFVFLGVSMGSAVTPESLERMATWPLSLVVLLLSVAATATAVAYWLERRHGWDRATARFSAIPGALSYTLALALKSPADVPRIALTQSLRLVTLVVLMPPLIQAGRSVDSGAVLARGAAGGPVDIALMLLLCGALGYGFKRLNVPAALLMGGLVMSAVLHGAGLIEARLPGYLLVPGFVVMGGVVGSRFGTTSPAALLRVLRPGLEAIAIGLVVSALFALFAAWLLRLPFGQTWLAYAPGGVEAMTVMAFALHVDPAFVGAHHFFRLIALSLLVPLWMRRTLREAGAPHGEINKPSGTR